LNVANMVFGNTGHAIAGGITTGDLVKVN
jgi:hypothetical protein